MRFPAALLAAVLAAAMPPGAAQRLPDLGDGAGADLPPHVERRIGEGIVRDIRLREPAFYDDPELTDYLNRLGARLVESSPGARQDFEFFAMREASINAFALPGGFVGVHTGLIAASENESEVASVLAHEIAHVTQRHIARLLGAQKQMQIPTMVALAAAILLGRSRPDLGSGAAAIAQGAAVQAQLGYTRDFEREADRVGFQALRASGFDTRAMGSFLEKMQRYTRLTDDGSVPGYLRTHPITTERIADAQSRAAGEPYRPHVDSLDYHLVRARLRADVGDAREAVEHFDAVVRDRRHASEAAARYGLAAARLRAGDAAGAREELARLRATGAASSMIETLAARVQTAAGDRPGAAATLEAALARYPQRRPVLYAYAQMLHDQGRHQETLAALAEPVRLYPRDARLQEARARAHAGLGQRLAQHQALAEMYVLRGSLPQAIEQLEMAQAARDGNFYELSVVDARLKALRAEHELEVKEAKRR